MTLFDALVCAALPDEIRHTDRVFAGLGIEREGDAPDPDKARGRAGSISEGIWSETDRLAPCARCQNSEICAISPLTDPETDGDTRKETRPDPGKEAAL